MALTGGPVTPSAVAVRAVPVAGAVLVATATTAPSPPLLALLTAGVTLALARPAAVGAWVALPAAAWLFVVGTPDPAATGRVLVAALGVYLLHTGTAAAAACPWSARVHPAVARRWGWRCLPPVALTTVVAALDAVTGELRASTLLPVAAALVVVLAAFAVACLLRAGDDGGPAGRPVP